MTTDRRIPRRLDRRSFLRGTATGIGAVAATAALGRWAKRADAASAARYPGHRSLVAVFLLGGNDANQLLVPRDARYTHYEHARRSIAIPKADLLPLDSAYGLHPKLTRLRAAFTAATPTASLVMNVGPAARPTLLADYLRSGFPKPTNLFSHSDQQDAWATAVPVPGIDPEHARSGWGGRVADAIESLNPPVGGATYPAMTLVGGRRTYAASTSVPLIVSASGELTFEPDKPGDYYALRREKLAELADVTSTHLQGAYGDVLMTSTAVAAERARARVDAWNALRDNTRNAIEGIFAAGDPAWMLSVQLFTVVKDIVAGATAASTGLGLRRQVFSVGQGGYDTHTNQRVVQDGLYEELDFSLDAFRRAMSHLATDPLFDGKPPQSTLFTMSDFGRTFSENSDGGTDHAWGNHMIVMGGRVAGGQLLGVFPNVDLEATEDSTDGRGRWLPSTTVEQYVYNLALWLGCTPDELLEILPNHAAYREDALARDLPVQYTRVQLPLMLDD